LVHYLFHLAYSVVGLGRGELKAARGSRFAIVIRSVLQNSLDRQIGFISNTHRMMAAVPAKRTARRTALRSTLDCKI
jgi:hypothetical protein